MGDWTLDGDWRDPKNNDLWQGVFGTNNPCPFGFRVPTSQEVRNEATAYSIINPTTAFNSPLKFPSAGYRNVVGDLLLIGSSSRLWTSSPVPSLHNQAYHAFSIDFGWAGLLAEIYTDRASGFNVRCIKD
jgi:hypothetical protein